MKEFVVDLYVERKAMQRKKREFENYTIFRKKTKRRKTLKNF